MRSVLLHLKRGKEARRFHGTGAEIVYQLRLMSSDRVVFVASIVLPLLILPILYSIGREASGPIVISMPDGALGVNSPQFSRVLLVSYGQYAMSVSAAYSVAVTSFSLLAIRLVTAREASLLKRVHTTPLRLSSYVAGHVGSVLIIALAMFAASVFVGTQFFEADVAFEQMPRAGLTVAVAALAFSTLGIAFSTLCSSVSVVSIGTFAVLLPLGLVSAVFYPPSATPPWMSELAEWLPLKPFSDALLRDLLPITGGEPLHLVEIVKLLGWSFIGLVITLARFSWLPHHENDRTLKARLARSKLFRRV